MGSDDLFKKKRERKEKDLRRKESFRKTNEVILIVCEGEKTEYNYLNVLKDYLRIPNAHIEIDNNSDSAPKSIVKYAKARGKEKSFDYIYCVFDKDKHISFNMAIDEIKKTNNMRHIVSNPCFEYWILLHFEYTTKSFGQNGGSPCQELINKCLETYLPNYQKKYDFNEIIETKLEFATNNSEQAYKNAEKNNFETSYTEMHLLVSKFLKL